MISKTLSTSQRYASLAPIAGKLAEFCQALYPLLVAHADDSGRQQGDAFTVKYAVCPSSPRQLPDIEKALTALHRVHLIAWYEVDGRKFIEISDFAQHQPGLKNRGNSQIPALPGNAVECRDLPSEGKGTEGNRTEEKRTEGKGTEPPAAPIASVPAMDSDRDPAAPPGTVEAFVQSWNTTVTAPMTGCRGISDQRREKIQQRLKERSMGDWLAIFQRIEASAFCHGDNDRQWAMSLDWLIKNNDHALRVLEGKYDDRQPAPSGPKADMRGHIPPCRTIHECIEKALADAKHEREAS